MQYFRPVLSEIRNAGYRFWEPVISTTDDDIIFDLQQ